MCSKLIHTLKSAFGLRQTIWELWTWILTNYSPLSFTCPSPPGSRPPDNCTALRFGEQLEGRGKKQPEDMVLCAHRRDRCGGLSSCHYWQPSGEVSQVRFISPTPNSSLSRAPVPPTGPWIGCFSSLHLSASVPLATRGWWYLPHKTVTRSRGVVYEALSTVPGTQRALSKWQQSSAGTTCFLAAGLLLLCGLWVEGRVALRVPRGNGILALSIGILSCNTARPGASLHVRDHGYPHTTAYCCHSHPDLCQSCLA